MNLPLQAIEKYLQRRKQDLVLIEEGLKAGDFEPLQRVGHQLKGNADTFGFPELAAIGRELEIAAKEKNLQLCTELVQKIAQWVTSKA